MSRTWHHGLVARWWGEFETGGDDVEVFRRFVERFGTPALDAGCGAGRVLVPLRQAGLDVDGTDVSPDMLEWCQARAAAAGVTVTTSALAMHELDLPRRYRTVFMAGVFGVGTSRAEDLEGLSRVHDHLEPGGTLVIDHHLPNLEDPRHWKDWIEEPALPQPFPERGRRRTAADGTDLELRMRPVRFDPFEQHAVMELEVTHSSGGEVLAVERHTIDLGLYFKNEIELMLRHVGFAEVTVTAFGEERPPHPWHDARIALVAHRP